MSDRVEIGVGDRIAETISSRKTAHKAKSALREGVYWNYYETECGLRLHEYKGRADSLVVIAGDKQPNCKRCYPQGRAVEVPSVDYGKRLEAAERTLAAVKALLPDWFAEPDECDPAHRCDGKVGCGASSCFASELMAAIYGEDENKWPLLAEITKKPRG